MLPRNLQRKHLVQQYLKISAAGRFIMLSTFPHTYLTTLFVKLFSIIFVVNQTPMNGAS
jgi:hypothetical protein